uniref:Uncharacterized protein n=1 Tax=Arundo donax TaxID=35708 RepID=A0A0A8Z8M2_ARUDO
MPRARHVASPLAGLRARRRSPPPRLPGARRATPPARRGGHRRGPVGSHGSVRCALLWVVDRRTLLFLDIGKWIWVICCSTRYPYPKKWMGNP